MQDSTEPTPSAALTVETVASINDIPAAQWQHFAGDHNPLVSHDFLEALERSGCTASTTGWRPCHLKFFLDGQWVGIAPAWLKNHSMGEYVFDWAWADAWQRNGQPYYPKLVIAVPFTPCQGPRLLLSDEARSLLVPGQVQTLLDQLIIRLGAHSWHLLFPDARDQALLESQTGLHRTGCQFHWFNHGYDCFDDFLGRLTSRKRKSIRKERRQVADQGISFKTWQGDALPEAVLADFHLFYSATYLKRGQRPYLNQEFFRLLAERLGRRLRIITAEQDQQRIAAALFIVGKDTLFGRYWGCLEEFDHLHFETCYYQGIDLAIAEGLARFDAGAQGEHKLVRGFEPVFTHSWHGIDHPGFLDAVARFCQEEAREVQAYRDAAQAALPFRQEAPPE